MNTQRHIIIPADEQHWLDLRLNDLTSTDIAALFGLSPYRTHFELWHEKASRQIVKLPDNPRMRWGRRLESTVAEGIAEDAGWQIRPMKEYMTLPGIRAGASFDFRVRARRDAEDSADDAILEIKTVDALAFRNGWTIEDDYVEAPSHIELQVQHQMLVSGLRRAYIGVLIGGNRIEVLERHADDQVHAGIVARARAFWASIERNEPPAPVMPDDAQAVIRLNQHAEPGKVLDARDDEMLAYVIERYNDLGREAKAVEDERATLKAEILQRIGDAEKVLVDGYSISAGVVGPAEVAYTRPGYRNLRVTAKKSKVAA